MTRRETEESGTEIYVAPEIIRGLAYYLRKCLVGVPVHRHEEVGKFMAELAIREVIPTLGIEDERRYSAGSAEDS